MHNLKIKGLIEFLIGISILYGCNQFQTTPLKELQQIGMDMKQIDHVEYSYQITKFSNVTGDTTISQGQMYFEKNAKDSSIGFNFYHKTETGESFFIGDYIINMQPLDSSALKKPLCDYIDGHMTLYPYLELSFGAIRNFLTDSLFCFQTDSLIKTDTVVENFDCSSYSFWADNILIDTHKKMRKGRKWINLVVRKKDNLPIEYSQKMKSHYYKVSFSRYSFDEKYSEELFTIENVPTFYKWDKYRAYMNILPTRILAPDWELPLLDGGTVSLSSLKGRYVLLDFWFIGCGACVHSIPILNALKIKYDNLEVIGINCFSNKVDKIKEYCSNQGMNYKNVWNGEKISVDYKVCAAPIFYLIDKNGLIIYSQIGHNEKKLKENIVRLINYAP